MTTDNDQPDEPVPPPGPEADAETPPARRPGVARRLVRLVGRILGVLVILLAAAIVTSVSVDLGPALRERAARAGGNYLKREMSIGRLSIRLFTGTFIVEDLRIGGLSSRRPAVLRGEADRAARAAAGAAAPRGARRVGRAQRLDDGGRDLAERAPQLSEVHARQPEPGPEAVRDDGEVRARRPRRVRVRGPRHAVGHRGPQPRPRRDEVRRLPRHGAVLEGHRDDSELPPHVGRHGRRVRDRERAGASSAAWTSSPTAR